MMTKPEPTDAPDPWPPDAAAARALCADVEEYAGIVRLYTAKHGRWIDPWRLLYRGQWTSAETLAYCRAHAIATDGELLDYREAVGAVDKEAGRGSA